MAAGYLGSEVLLPAALGPAVGGRFPPELLLEGPQLFGSDKDFRTGQAEALADVSGLLGLVFRALGGLGECRKFGQGVR